MKKVQKNEAKKARLPSYKILRKIGSGCFGTFRNSSPRIRLRGPRFREWAKSGVEEDCQGGEVDLTGVWDFETDQGLWERGWDSRLFLLEELRWEGHPKYNLRVRAGQSRGQAAAIHQVGQALHGKNHKSRRSFLFLTLVIYVPNSERAEMPAREGNRAPRYEAVRFFFSISERTYWFPTTTRSRYATSGPQKCSTRAAKTRPTSSRGTIAPRSSFSVSPITAARSIFERLDAFCTH